MSANHIRVYDRAINVRTVRRVWAAVTATPQATVRELGAQLGMQFGDVTRAIIALRQAGYVEQTYRSARSRRVVVPFVEVRR